MNPQEVLLPLFAAETTKKPVYVNAPMCCGTDIYWFPPKFATNKIKCSFEPYSVTSKRIIIVLGKHFPRFVKRICKQVGVVITQEYEGEYKKDAPKKLPCMNISDHLQSRYNADYSVKNSVVRNVFKSPTRKMSAGVQITRLEDKIYYLDSLYYVNTDDLKELIGLLRRGDILLATATSHQSSSRKILEDSGLRKVRETFGTHGNDYKMFLYYFKKK